MAGSTISVTLKLDSDHKSFESLVNDTEALKKFMSAAIVESEKLKTSLINWSQSVQALDAVSDAVGQLNNMLQKFVVESNSFDKAMRVANTMAGKNAGGFKELKGQVADLAKHIPVARDVLANGLYQVISNGVPEDNWIDYLDKSARASAGGVADLGQTVTVTSTIIKNYGLAWDAAGSIQDKIQLTAKNGVTSFEQLAAQLPRVAGTAATLDVSIDELLGTFATLTGVSGNTAEVATQLSAIFTSLIKPTAQASEMADKMGISFDAAAIKGAGGMQNFLKSLDVSVKKYASANGVLEQEVYGKLFGSAEALRALIPLNGELADKFATNAAQMQNSAGAVDQAFAEVNKSSEAVAQKLKNQMASFTDFAASIAASAGPFLDFAANAGIAVMSTTSLIKTLKRLHIMQTLVSVKNKAAGASMLLFGLKTTRTAAFVRVFSSAMRGGALSATAFRIALRGLMLAAGIGVVIVGVTSVIEAFSRKTDEATDKIDDFKEAQDAFKSTAAGAKVEIDKEIKALGDLINSKKDTSGAVDHLNETYGEIFGRHKTAAEWYDILVGKSQAYVRQLGREAQAKILATKMAENQLQIEENERKATEMREKGTATIKRTVFTHGVDAAKVPVGANFNSPEYQALLDDTANLKKSTSALAAEFTVAQKQVEKYATEVAASVGSATKQVEVGAMTWQQVGDAIEKTEKKLKNTNNPDEIKRLKEYNTQLKVRKTALSGTLGIQDTKGGVTSKDNYADSLAKLTRDRVDAENSIIQNGLNREIAIARTAHERYLNDTKTAYEKGIALAVGDDEKKKRLTDEYQKLVIAKDKAHLDERIEILEKYSTGQINEYMRQTGDVDAATQATTTKLAVIKPVPINIPEATEVAMESDIIVSLRARLEGVEEVKKGLANLRALLNLGNLTQEERAAVQESIATWEAYGKSLGMTVGRQRDVQAISSETSQAISAIGNVVGSASGLVDDQTAGWLNWGTQVLGAIASAIPAIVALTATQIKQANANMLAATTGAAASVSSIPIIGWIMAGAAVASVIAAMASVPKFADGGIAYGPTLGIFGEYSGARNNPEVVAPLNKLQSLLEPADGGGTVRFRIEGRTLVGILEKENKHIRRTR